jgi:hypothetical protein
VKYLLIVFYMTGQWPLAPQMGSSQHGPYDNILACEAAARQAEMIVMSIGATRVGSFCSQTKVR